MACASCARKKKSDGYTHPEALQHPPFNANDIQLYDNGAVRRLGASDWPEDRHKLVLFYPTIQSKLCDEEGSLSDWTSEFSKLGCDLYIASTEQVHIIKDWLENEASLKELGVKAISSYLLPTRLDLMNNGQAMHASVFITKEAEVVVQHHFLNVGRSISALHKMLFAYVNGSSCAHGWQDPFNSFTVETEKNDGA